MDFAANQMKILSTDHELARNIYDNAGNELIAH